MQFIKIVSTAIVVGVATLALPAAAERTPETPELYHPSGTVGPLLPAECHVLRRIDGEQHRDLHGVTPQVREFDVYRLGCRIGDKHRTVLAFGPWYGAFVYHHPPR